MHKCSQCGGKLYRVHRTFFERFSYMAIYSCKDCETEEFVPRRYRFHLDPHARCPSCGTYRVVKLKARDRIDPMYVGFLNLLERLAGGRLFHCRYCRCQFYDRRNLASESPSLEVEPTSHVTTPRDTASSGA
jgi:DNA-directed RNA polymerase subunit RPC12/RpoP